MQLLLKHGAKPDTSSGDALVAASWGGILELVQFLVEKGFDVNTRMDLNYSTYPSTLAAAVDCDNFEVVQYLLEGGADPNIPIKRDGSVLV